MSDSNNRTATFSDAGQTVVSQPAPSQCDRSLDGVAEAEAPNMAEVINFLATGERDMGQRPKADTTSTYVATNESEG